LSNLSGLELSCMSVDDEIYPPPRSRGEAELVWVAPPNGRDGIRPDELRFLTSGSLNDPEPLCDSFGWVGEKKSDASAIQLWLQLIDPGGVT
jgi:hypothetical protein